MAQPTGQQQGNARPGAMTMAMQAVNIKPSGPKVLKIGLIQNGKIVEEKVIGQRETVSVGTSERNHFIIQAEGLPSRFEVFQLVGQDYILNFTDQMTGKLGLSGGVSQLEQLRTTGGARNAGGYWQVKLNDQSRGRITIGDTTILFQFVSPPPVVPKPQLPVAVQSGFIKDIDWPFTAFVVSSFMLFFCGFIVLETHDPIYHDESADALPELAQYLFEEPTPPEEPDVDPNAQNNNEQQQAQQTPQRSQQTAQNQNQNSQSTGQEQSEPSEGERSAAIRDEAAQQAQALLLTAFGGQNGGAFQDVLSGGAVTNNSAEVLASAGGVGVAERSGTGTIRTRAGGEGSGQGGDLGGIRNSASAGNAASEGDVGEREITGRVSVSGGGDIGGSGEFDESQVRAAMRRASGAIRRCYENELRNNPSLSGKISVQFTIQTSGTVSGASASENTTNSAGLASCVTAAVARSRFNPGPEGGSVQYRYPFVFSPQN